MAPTLFVGSSSESRGVAYAVQRNLEDDAEVVVWDQGIFELSKSYLESLMELLDDTDFGLFVFGPDDQAKIRGEEVSTTRRFEARIPSSMILWVMRGMRRSAPTMAKSRASATAARPRKGRRKAESRARELTGRRPGASSESERTCRKR